MTIGEIATWFQKTDLKVAKLKLSVNPLDSWSPDRLFNECSLNWIPPSPNIPTPETALLYTGTCLFEGTNVSEGRGTATPFSIIGAPWMDAERVIASIPGKASTGIQLVTESFTPIGIPGKAADPKFMNVECRGIHMTLQAPRAARPFTLAVALLAAIRRIHADRFAWENSFDVLTGSPTLRERIDHGDDPLQIIRDDAAPLAEFDAKRPKLYIDEPKNA